MAKVVAKAPIAAKAPVAPPAKTLPKATLKVPVKPVVKPKAPVAPPVEEVEEQVEEVQEEAQEEEAPTEEAEVEAAEEPGEAEVEEGIEEELPVEEAEGDVVPIDDQLTQLDDLGWEETEEKAFGEITDGNYPVMFTEAVIGNAKSSGRLQASLTMQIVDTPAKGRNLWKHFGLDTPEARGWFRGSLAKLGIEWPKSAKELPEVLESIKGSFAEVKVKSNKRDPDNHNIYVLQAIDGSGYDVAGVAEEEAPPEEVTEETDAGTPTEEAEVEAAEEPGEAEVEGLTVNFDDTALKKNHLTILGSLIGPYDFNPEDYSTNTDLMSDIAEHMGLTGEFDNPNDLTQNMIARHEELEAANKPTPAPVKKPAPKLAAEPPAPAPKAPPKPIAKAPVPKAPVKPLAKPLAKK